MKKSAILIAFAIVSLLASCEKEQLRAPEDKVSYDFQGMKIAIEMPETSDTKMSVTRMTRGLKLQWENEDTVLLVSHGKEYLTAILPNPDCSQIGYLMPVPGEDYSSFTRDEYKVYYGLRRQNGKYKFCSKTPLAGTFTFKDEDDMTTIVRPIMGMLEINLSGGDCMVKAVAVYTDFHSTGDEYKDAYEMKYLMLNSARSYPYIADISSGEVDYNELPALGFAAMEEIPKGTRARDRYPDECKPFYLSVPPGEHPNLTIAVMDEFGNVRIKRAKKAVKVEAGYLYPIDFEVGKFYADLEFPGFGKKWSLSQIKYSDWMNLVPDHMLLSHLTIPATHESATGATWEQVAIHFGAQDQELKMKEQFEKGVRFFDIRVDEDLKLYHGPAYMWDDLSGVFDVVVNCLKAHPRECAIVKIQEETISSESEHREFFTNLKTALDILKKDYSEYFTVFHGDMEMGDIRGKMALVFSDSDLLTQFNDKTPSPFAGEKLMKEYGAYMNDGHLYYTLKDGTVVYDKYRYHNVWEFKYIPIWDSFKTIYKEKKAPGMKAYFKAKYLEYDSWGFCGVSGYFTVTGAPGPGGSPMLASFSNKDTATFLKLVNRPMGIISFDWAGVEIRMIDSSVYEVHGDNLVKTCVEHNFLGAQPDSYTYPWESSISFTTKQEIVY